MQGKVGTVTTEKIFEVGAYSENQDTWRNVHS